MIPVSRGGRMEPGRAHSCPSVPVDIKRKQGDGREDKYIFVRHVEESEGIVIMGPSEHN
jgi:hypothetical protein